MKQTHTNKIGSTKREQEALTAPIPSPKQCSSCSGSRRWRRTPSQLARGPSAPKTPPGRRGSRSSHAPPSPACRGEQASERVRWRVLLSRWVGQHRGRIATRKHKAETKHNESLNGSVAHVNNWQYYTGEHESAMSSPARRGAIARRPYPGPPCP